MSTTRPGSPAGARVRLASGPCRRTSVGRAGRRALDVPQVPGQAAELGIGRRQLAPSGHQRREPAGIEAGRPCGGLGLVGHVDVRIDDVAGRLQVCVDGLAGDEQVHDLGRPFEDPVDPRVAKDLLCRHGPLSRDRSDSPSRIRVRPDLHGSSATSQAISLDHSLASAASIRMSWRPASASCADRSRTACWAKVVAAMKEILCAIAACRPTGRPHYREADAHSQAILTLHFEARAQAGIEPAGVQRRQCDLEAVAFAGETVGSGNPHLVEPGEAVLDALQAHERVAPLDGDSRESDSTTKAVIPPRPCSCSGTGP